MRNIFLIIGAETGGDFFYICILYGYLSETKLSDEFSCIIPYLCIFAKVQSVTGICACWLRRFPARDLKAFGLMVLPYAISVLCTVIGIVPLMVFLAFGRENKKQRMVRILSSWLSIVLLNGWQLQFTI